MKRKLRVLDLFSGIGGFSLGLEMTGGFEAVCFVEVDPFCRAVLRKHWPRVRQFRDVRSVTAARLDFSGVTNIDVICGGFPCQPYSVAGQRKGHEDDRHLWPEMRRVIAQVQPTWVIGENVTGIIPMALDGVLADLEALGYAAQSFVIPACAVDARHRRDRVWIIARSTGSGASAGKRAHDGAVPDASCDGREQGRTGATEQLREPRGLCDQGWPAAHADCGELRHQSGRSHGTDGKDSTEPADHGAARAMADAAFQLSHGIGGVAGAGGRDESADRCDVVADTDKAGRSQHRRSIAVPTPRVVTQCSGGSVAHTNDQREQQPGGCLSEVGRRPCNGGAPRADASHTYGGPAGWIAESRPERCEWSPEPGVGRVASGISGRVHRLKSLGNAVVPQVVAEIGYAILATTERAA